MPTAVTTSRYRKQRNISFIFNGVFLILIFLQSLYVSHQAVKNERISLGAHGGAKQDFIIQRPENRFSPKIAASLSNKTTAAESAAEAEIGASKATPSKGISLSSPSRIFPRWNNPFPCASWEGKMKRTETNEGFLYLKEIKTGSSTLAGVTIRIARNLAQRQQTKQYMCRARFQHLRARKFEFRNRSQSFLWTVVRDPTTRLVSKFFHFGVSRQGLPPTGDALEIYYRAYTNWIMDHAYYMKTMTLRDINPREITMYENYTQTILDDFDFVGTTERFDESLVVLKILLGLEFGDILYLSVKSAQSYEFLPNKQSCSQLVPKVITPDMKLFFQSEFWKNYTQADEILYQGAQRSLELTIDALGRDLVARELALFRKAQGIAYDKCAAITEFPCNARGEDRRKKTDCLFNDSGCGYKCLDEVAKKLKSLPKFNTIP